MSKEIESYYQSSIGIFDNDILLLDVFKEDGLYYARLFGDGSGREWCFYEESFLTKEEAFAYGKAQIKCLRDFLANVDFNKVCILK